MRRGPFLKDDDYAVTAHGCWRWQHAIHHTGYGSCLRGGIRLAHRLYYEMLVGPIPAGLEIDHLCRNRWCVNPAHLEPVTRRENSRRGESPWAINARKTHCVHGHAFDGANTYLRPDGSRGCRRCVAMAQRAYRARKKETA